MRYKMWMLYMKIKMKYPKMATLLKRVWHRINKNKNIMPLSAVSTFSENLQDPNYYEQVFNKIKNDEINIDNLDIAFIIPEPIKGSGGHRNFFRAIKYLHDFGHNLIVYYIESNLPAKIVKERASNWFYDMSDIPFIRYEGQMGYHDVAFATWWKTVYVLKQNSNKIKYCFYYVQDFEPYFSPMSTDFVLASCSYKQGFAHICSGPWCRDFLIEKYNAEADYFQFPIDRTVYNTHIPRTKKNKNIIFFAKPEMPRRCYELGIDILKRVTKERPDIEIILFGSDTLSKNDIPFKVTILKLLPTIQDLANIYRNADLGIVFSTTNPSLVPYEMMSCGCPVADLDFELSISKYGGSMDNVFLFDPRPEIFAQNILDIIDNSNLLKYKATFGKKWVDEEFPTELEMAHMIENMIKKKIITGSL